MRALALRRVLLLTVPLALVLAGCNREQGKSVAGPDLGEANPAVGEAPLAMEPAIPICTDVLIAASTPCQGPEAGSSCTPTDDVVVGPSPEDWHGGLYPPEFKWSYPCAPAYYSVSLRNEEGQYQANTLISGTETAWEPPAHSWSPQIPLQMGKHYYYWIGVVVDQNHSTWGKTSFWTGPLCWGAWGLDGQRLPELLEPLDDAEVQTQEQSMKDYVALAWDYVMYTGEGCLVQFEGQVSTDKTFTTGVMPILSTGSMEHSGVVGGTVEWCHTYYWRVRAYSTTVKGNWSETHSFKIAPPEGWNTCFQTKVHVTATRNASCRIGPGTIYGILSYVAAGESHPVEGRNADGTWLKLQDLECYVSASLFTLVQEGTPFPTGPDVGSLLSTLPELPDPPTPTVPTTECKPTMGSADCVAAGGMWECEKNPFGGCTSSKCDCP